MLISAFCRPAERFHPSKSGKHVNSSSLVLSEACLLLNSLTYRLSDYKSSLQEDEEILKKLKKKDNLQLPDGTSYTRYEMAVQVRKGEKEILHQLLQLTQDLIDEQTRQMTPGSAKRRASKNDMPAANKKTSMRNWPDALFYREQNE